MSKLYRLGWLGLLVLLLNNCQAQHQPSPTAAYQPSPTEAQAVVAAANPSQLIATPTQTLELPTNERVLVRLKKPELGIDVGYFWLAPTGELTPVAAEYPSKFIRIFAEQQLAISHRFNFIQLFDFATNQYRWELEFDTFDGTDFVFAALDEAKTGVYLTFERSKPKLGAFFWTWMYVQLSDGSILEQHDIKLSTISQYDCILNLYGAFWCDSDESGNQISHYDPRTAELTTTEERGIITFGQQQLFVLHNKTAVLELDGLTGMQRRTIQLTPPLGKNSPYKIIVSPDLKQIAIIEESLPFSEESIHTWHIYNLETGTLLDSYSFEQRLKLVPSYQTGYWYLYLYGNYFIDLWHPQSQQRTSFVVGQPPSQAVGNLFVLPQTQP